jgi:hypothetical protein
MTVEQRPVETKEAFAGWTPLVKGVEAGESVVISGISKLGPGVTARLPHIVSSHQFKAVQSIIDELKRQFQANDTEVIIGDDGVRETADKMVGRMDIAMSFMIDVLNARREQPLDTDYDVVIDINSDEAVAIRLYLGDEARG